MIPHFTPRLAILKNLPSQSPPFDSPDGHSRKGGLGGQLSALRQSIPWVLLSIVSTLLYAAPAQAARQPDRVGTVLERVKRTGVLVAGTRVDAMPMAYRQADDQWMGYSVEMLEQIRQQIQQQIRRPVELQIVAIDSTNQMTKIMQGEVDLVCGSTSITQGRELDVNFSVGYFQTGTQLLFDTAGSLGLEFTIGVLQGTTNQQVVERLFPIAQVVPFASRPLGFAALGRGQVDALASDGILLEGLRLSSPEPERFELFPDQPYDQEIYGCMVPKEDPEFQQAVNTSLVSFMQGVLDGSPAETAILDHWFGPTGIIPLDQQPLLNLFREQIELYRQLQQHSVTPRPTP